MELKDILAKCDHTLLTQTATCPDHAAQLETYCRENGVRLKVHIAVDTGMHRIGFLPEDLDAIRRVYENGVLHIKFPKKEALKAPEKKTILIEG